MNVMNKKPHVFWSNTKYELVNVCSIDNYMVFCLINVFDDIIVLFEAISEWLPKIALFLKEFISCCARRRHFLLDFKKSSMMHMTVSKCIINDFLFIYFLFFLLLFFFADLSLSFAKTWMPLTWNDSSLGSLFQVGFKKTRTVRSARHSAEHTCTHRSKMSAPAQFPHISFEPYFLIFGAK